MQNIYHILNGDALKNYFPKTILGTIIIARECLIDGNINGSTLEEFYTTRSNFLKEHYQSSDNEYQEKVINEFDKINDIPDGSTINFWFEDDLFCQANFWFMIHLFNLQNKSFTYFLVRPTHLTQYGFAAYDTEGLTNLYKKKVSLASLAILKQLWPAYQSNKINNLKVLGEQLQISYPFINNAITAHIERLPTKNTKGKPSEILQDIVSQHGKDNFGVLFREFSKQAPIYGFGDLQVKKLLDELEN